MLPLFLGDTIIYIKNPKRLIFLRLLVNRAKIEDTSLVYKNTTIFLYNSNEQLSKVT